MKKNKGITLIALVVTIIVLLILAGITISLLLGENGIITRAREATEAYEEAAKKEREYLNNVFNDQPSTAEEVVNNMQLGWNLGNTLDAHFTDSYEGKTVEDFETLWGNPVVTKELIDAVKNKGFDTLRIPITWYQHLDANNVIDPEWLARVKEVVDYGMQNNMYVIINTHHEYWFTLDGSVPENELQEKANKLWQQIATEFKDYNYKLMFEIFNEPRNLDKEDEWTGNTNSYEMLNRIEQTILTTIRKSGGNNEKRCVLLPVYAGKIKEKTLSAFKMPEDKYVIVSVHSYVPTNFTKSTTAIYDSSVVGEIEEVYEILQSFKKANPNIPMILGETGCAVKEDGVSHIKWAERLMTLLGKLDIPCILWDTGRSYSYIDRDTLVWKEEKFTNTIFTFYKKARNNKENNSPINLISKINEEATNVSVNTNTASLNMKSQVVEGIRHFTLSTTSDYTGGSQLRFKFSDTYSLSGNNYYKFTGKIKTNMSALKIRAVIYFYDDANNLLYTADYDTFTDMVDGSKTEYEFSIPYYVEGATKIQIERLALSSSETGAIEFDLYDLKVVDN